MRVGTAVSDIAVLLLFFLCVGLQCLCSAQSLDAVLDINASEAAGKKIPDTLFGIFFEEINHAGAGGLWAELVSNRGFEAGGQTTPSRIEPWSIIGDDYLIYVSTDRTSPFDRNKIALRMEVLCDDTGSLICPQGGVGIYNPGFWGMNIEDGKSYELTLYVRSLGSINISASLTSSDGFQTLASDHIIADAHEVSNWTKVVLNLDATGTIRDARLQLTTNKKGVIWLDQVSLMPVDTYKGLGFRKELVSMIADLKPRFIRYPGGCFVEGERLPNAFRWKESIGPWEERPGHWGDVWMYWTDDGLGYLEFLQLAKELGAASVWVVNNGISHREEVETAIIAPFVQEALDSIEFARGSSNSTWGSLRAKLGHPEPFELKYVAVGNEDCGKTNYEGNYLKFYKAIKSAYPDIKIISNCDASKGRLTHPADYYDFHTYTSSQDLFSMNNKFDKISRTGPKAFVSEYAVFGDDAGNGTLLAALGEAAFLLGLERNGDAVEMASYAPLFVNTNDRMWTPDAIVFDSWQQFGTPSYWMQQFFKESSGATFFPSTLEGSSSSSLVASAIIWKDSEGNRYLKIKIVNYGNYTVKMKISVKGLENSINKVGSTQTVLTSSNVMDENSFSIPTKVAPLSSKLPNAGTKMYVVLAPNSFTSYDLAISERNENENVVKTRM